LRCFDSGELEIDEHVVWIVDRLHDPLAKYAALLASRCEPSERVVPGVEVTDGMLDEQCGNGSSWVCVVLDVLDARPER